MARQKKPRMRKAYLNRWTKPYINVGSGVDKLRMQELSYGKRAEAPTERMLKMFVPTVNDGRKRVLDQSKIEAIKARLEEIASIRFLEHQILLKKSKFEIVHMIYGMKGSNCLIIKTLRGGVFFRSRLYPSRDIAKEHFKNGTIHWDEVVQYELEAPANE